MANTQKETKEVKPEVVEPRAQDLNSITVVIKTELDAYISDIVKGGPQKPEDIKITDFTPTQGRHRLSLPEPLEKKYGNKYAFRWVNKKKNWIDRALFIRKWLIVNRALFPDMPKVLFTANGTIENGDTILCFMPMEKAERLRREPGRLSTERVRNLPMEQWKDKREDSPFYKPTLGQEERDGEMSTAGIQPDIQPQTE